MRLADLQFRNRGPVVVANATGEIDASNADEVERALIGAVSNESLALVVDLSAVEYLDSAGIRLIYRLREGVRVRGQILRLVVPGSSPLHDALRLAGVGSHVETCEQLGDALSGLVPG